MSHRVLLRVQVLNKDGRPLYQRQWPFLFLSPGRHEHPKPTSPPPLQRPEPCRGGYRYLSCLSDHTGGVQELLQLFRFVPWVTGRTSLLSRVLLCVVLSFKTLTFFRLWTEEDRESRILSCFLNFSYKRDNFPLSNVNIFEYYNVTRNRSKYI